MNINPVIRIIVIFLILCCNIGCDQMSKHFVRRSIDDSEQLSFISNRLTIMKVENEGAFLSIGSNLPQPFKSILLSFLPVFVLSLALLFVITQKGLSKLSVVGICFVVGGGIGNIYDRVMYGSVTDFLFIDFGVFHTGVFNMADVSVMAGMAMILVESYLKRVSNFSDSETN